MIKLGLTGYIGAGKTTASNFFKQLNVKVFNDDEQVKKLLSNNNIFNKIILKSGIKDLLLENLSNRVLENPSLLKILEEVLHPLINQKRKIFIWKNYLFNPKGIILFDCPLLFEKNIDFLCDYVIVAECDIKLQTSRVLERENFSIEKFDFIYQKQIATKIKKDKIDFIINTNKSILDVKHQVYNILAKINER